MKRFKISIHCGPVNTYVVEEHDNKQDLLSVWDLKISAAIGDKDMLIVGDVLINPAQITFVVLDEVVLEDEKPVAEEAIVEA